MGLYPRLGPWGRFRRDHAETVARAIDTLDLTDLADRRIAELSGGQQQRVFLARALAGGARVLLLDEPFAGLDEEARRKLKDTLRTLANEGRLVLASHHDLRSVPEVFDTTLLLRTTPIAAGPPGEALTPENLRRAFS